MTHTIIELTEEEFAAQHKLRTNHLNPNAGWAYGEGAGCLFETYGAELAFVQSQDPRTVWTITDGAASDQYLLSGFHLVNRIGYLISTVPVPEGTTIKVRVPMQSDEDAENSAHTPEPWGDNQNGIILGNLDEYTGVAPIVAVVEGYDEDGNANDEATANTRRICAAVNACNGFPIEALEQNAAGRLYHLLREAFYDPDSELLGENWNRQVETLLTLLEGRAA
jgi:hypothetical protein